MAGKYDELIEAAVGPNYWHHDLKYCECALDAPENEDAFMSQSCIENFHTGALERLHRGQALLELVKIIEDEARDDALKLMMNIMRRV